MRQWTRERQSLPPVLLPGTNTPTLGRWACLRCHIIAADCIYVHKTCRCCLHLRTKDVCAWRPHPRTLSCAGSRVALRLRRGREVYEVELVREWALSAQEQSKGKVDPIFSDALGGRIDCGVELTMQRGFE